MSEIKELIRQLLREELAQMGAENERAPKPQITEEVISIRSSADLNTFACRILELAQDGKKRADILSGKHVFRLNTGAHAAPGSAYHQSQPQAHMPQAPSPRPMAEASFTKGMVTEREINSLPESTNVVLAGKNARFTPLARDELRRRGIKLERMSK